MKRSPSSTVPRFSDDFVTEARKGAPRIVREFVQFLRQERKWFLVPFVLVLLMMGALVVSGSTGGGPLIYSLF